MRILPITSPDNPRLKQVLHLRKSRDRRKSNHFIAEGLREVERALAAGLKLRELYVSPHLLGMEGRDLHNRLPDLGRSNALLLELPPKLLQKIAYHDDPEGILAVVESPEWDLEKLKPANPLWLIANGINKPGNLGAMARTACAAGATGILAADADVDPFNPNSIRASTGAVFSLPIIAMSSEEAVIWLKQQGIRIAATTLDTAISYTQDDMRGPLAIAIGREETGLSAFWLDSADARITIPMNTTHVDSLNASNAAAILLFEAIRQRQCHFPSH